MPESRARRARLAATGLAALTCACPALADVHAQRDPDGGIMLSDRPGSAPADWIIRDGAEGPRAGPAPMSDPRALPFQAEIESVSAALRIDPRLVRAVVEVESSYVPGAVSRKGAAGLMQLMPSTAARYSVRDRFNPGQNLEGGARYLADLLRMFPGELGLALAAYNAGEGAVIRHGRKIPPFPETRAYVERVLSRFAQLSGGGAQPRS